MNSFKTRFLSILILVCLLATFPTSSVRAASRIYRVSTTPFMIRDCGGSWKYPCSLLHAMNSAVAGDQIWVKAGTYQPTPGSDRTVSFIPKNGVAIYGGFAGNEMTLEQRDPVANLTILSGDIGVAGDKSDNSYSVVLAYQVDDTTLLDGFTIRDGYANGPVGTYYSFGAGMLVRMSASLMLTNLVFRENEAVRTPQGNGGYGGGLYNEGNPTLTNVTFHANIGSLGGAISSFAGNPTLRNVTFSENRGSGGGGLFIANGSPTLTNVTFAGNVTVGQGAGIYNHGGSPVLTYVTFSGNQATDTYYGIGGAIYDALGTVVLSNSIVWGNSAPTGPQIYNAGSALTRINSSVVQGGCPAGSTCSGLITANPRLASLGSNGGLTQTMPLLPGSSARDTGDPATCPFIDQRGVRRPQGRYCDIGAYEVLNSVGLGTYDDSHPAWIYNGSWVTSQGKGAYNNTLHRSNTANSVALVEFRGAQVQLMYFTGPNHGTIDVYIDQRHVDTIDTNTLMTSSATWTSPVLDDNVHVHMVVFQAAGRGWIDLDAIQVLEFSGVGPGTYDDADPAWSYTSGWTTYNGAGPHNDTMHYTNVQNASASLTFIGTHFTVHFANNTNRGDVEVWIDGVLKYTFSEYAGAIAWQRTWTLPLPLSYGVHTVQFRNANASTATYIDIDAITILEPVGVGIYDDIDPAWSYTGNWTTLSVSGPYNNTIHYTSTIGDSAGLVFDGTRFTLTFSKFSNRGLIDIYVDEAYVTTLDAYSPDVLWQQTYTSPTYPPGTHSVRFSYAGGGTYIDVDAITILP